MQVADKFTVLGDFDDATFTYNGITSTFFQRDGKFFVRTDGPDGELQDFEIAYTFGAVPLQQYLIEFPNGRYQMLSLCWDTRPERKAGSGGFTSTTLMRVSTMRMSCIGPGRIRTGTSCVPSATRPI